MAKPTPNEPLAPVPDVKDWSWVTKRACPDCGFDPSTLARGDLPGLIRSAARRFEVALEDRGADQRPAPQTWSAVEYGQHVADVCEVMSQRLEAILHSGGEGVEFDDWDQDAAAIKNEYWLANAHAIAVLIKERAEGAAKAWAEPQGEQWDWIGIRGDGSTFTTESLGRYFAHDLIHHLHDVGG